MLQIIHFVSLVPKKQAANRVEQFCPIALCNVAYKIITKIMSSLLKDTLNQLIHPNQSAFIPNRSIIDNGIINHEVIFYLNSKKGKKGYMAIKIDMAKAYDKVEWSVLMAILKQHGFNDRVCDMIMECLSTTLYSILINGSPVGFFPSTRGLRQGDPISPALFTILADLLSRILAKFEMDGKLNGVKIARGSPRITHLMYADDLVIYCQAVEDEAKEVFNYLHTYCT